MLADKQVPVLDLTNSTITSQADLQTAFQSLHCVKKAIYPMAENNPKKKKIPTDYISDSESSEEETNQYLRTSQEERLYHTVKGFAQGTQAALAHTMAQCNPTVERGLAKQPKIKKLTKGQALDKSTQTKEKGKSH